MASIAIAATKREKKGKGYARKLRAQGKIPANIIGAGKSTPIELESKLLAKAWKDNERMFDLDLEGQKKSVRIHELQIDPVKRYPLHVDLVYAE
jgi:large subunit ribosomal protein L25